MNVVGHIYGCQETMNLNFFQSFNRDFSPLKYVRGTYITLFQPTFEISYGQVYGCQVFLVTIYGLDMIAKIYLWWLTRDANLMTGLAWSSKYFIRGQLRVQIIAGKCTGVVTFIYV